MKLLKTRDFNAFFSDTFEFLKLNGKHYVKNYVIINGLFLIAYLATFVPFINIFSNYIDSDGYPEDTLQLMLEQEWQAILLWGTVAILVGIIYGVVNLSFNPVYFKRYSIKNNTDFSLQDIIDDLKKNFFKGIKYFIGMIILFIPLMIVLGLAVAIVACTIIGILIPISAFALLVTFTVYEYYFKEENHFFSSFGYAWDLLTTKFWHSVGCVALLTLCIAIVQQLISAVMNAVLGIQTNNFNYDYTGNNPMELFTSEFIVGLLISVIATSLISFFLNIISYVNMGIIYYSLKEEKEGLGDAIEMDIEEIGTSDL